MPAPLESLSRDGAAAAESPPPQRSPQSSTHGAGALPSPGCCRNSQPPPPREEELAQRLLIVFSRSFISRFAHLSSTTASCHLHQPRAWHCLNAPVYSLFSVVKKKIKIILSPPQTCTTPAVLEGCCFSSDWRSRGAHFSCTFRLCCLLFPALSPQDLAGESLSESWNLKNTYKSNKCNISPAAPLNHVQSHIHSF